jgi:hypothetical protein
MTVATVFPPVSRVLPPKNGNRRYQVTSSVPLEVSQELKNEIPARTLSS